MEVVQSMSRSAKRDPNRTPSNREMRSNGSSTRQADENQSPENVTKGLMSMLKTTTETGDIGIFSIKPSRLPQSHSTPRRPISSFNGDLSQSPRQAFQPYGVPSIDDRRRLPSYTRDVTSEVVSMYETASQKSRSRLFEDPEYRSCSLTQTSYPAYTLSNHRSYTSLRSQQEVSVLLQRPRSPFAYPTRLKRPGFRPSSPALTDGGIIDYSRRAEIERAPYGTGNKTTSPSSLYAQKRRPPTVYRPEGNRSTPSLLSQSSPPRRTSSPYIVQGNNGNLKHEGYRKNGPPSVNTSPARSTFSLASTVNFCAIGQAASMVTTPGKLHPPSPRYYDYTEDFDHGEYSQSGTFGPPPQFRINIDTLDYAQNSGFGKTSRIQEVSSGPIKISAPLLPQISIKKPASSALPTGEKNWSESEKEVASGDSQITLHPENKAIHLSALGNYAGKLGSRFQEVFALQPSLSFDSTVNHDFDGIDRRASHTTIDQIEMSLGVNSSTSSSQKIFVNSPQQPIHSMDTDRILTNSQVPVGLDCSGDVSTRPGELQEYHVVNSALLDSRKTKPENENVENPVPVSLKTRVTQARASSAGCASNRTGFTELVELASSLEEENRIQCKDTKSLGTRIHRTGPINSPNIAGRLKLQASSSDRRLPPTGTILAQHQVSKCHDEEEEQPMKQRLENYSRNKNDLSSKPDDCLGDVPDISHNLPRRLLTSSESPMLAPKPISPARQLKLKNSVPHLMKALPPLPPEPYIRAVPPPAKCIPNLELPCRFSPLLPESKIGPAEKDCDLLNRDEMQVAIQPSAIYSPAQYPSVEKRRLQTRLANGTNKPSSKLTPRLKLNMKASTSHQSSTPDSRSWNIDASCPWGNQDLSVTASPMNTEEAPISKLPRFKLKVTHATDSCQSTVRINQDFTEQNHIGILHLRNHMDLFTPVTGVDDVPYQMGGNLHLKKSRKSSSSLNEGGQTTRGFVARQAPGQWQTSEGSSPASPTHINPLAISEPQSVFSDDSSQFQTHGSLRKRISNFRARIAAPHSTKISTQSFDDVTFGVRNATDTPKSPASRSSTDFQMHNEHAPARRICANRLHTQRLKSKMRAWIYGAKSIISTRLKVRLTRGRDDEDLGLTTA